MNAATISVVVASCQVDLRSGPRERTSWRTDEQGSREAVGSYQADLRSRVPGKDPLAY